MTNTMNPAARTATQIGFISSNSVHPDYNYWADSWDTIRDCEIGEIEIKRKSTRYLTKIESQTTEQYQAYLKRAVFYNMFSRTLHALYGTVFIRNPKITGIPAKLKEKTKRITKEDMSLHLLAKTTVRELLAMGRYGMMVDAPKEKGKNPYIVTYTAENIIDWEEELVGGRWTLTRVVLRELTYDRHALFSTYDYKQRYRVLKLEDTNIEGVSPKYVQYVFDTDETKFTPDVNSIPTDIINPTVRGESLDYIPFQFFGPFTNSSSVQKPPMLDIATLNISHYNAYASIEHARHYIASPIYVVEGLTGNSSDEFFVGPDILWTLPPNAKAQILEFTGQGLKHLEYALTSKESQIAAIGGRMMPGVSQGSAESDNSLMLKEQNENTLLLNISDTVDEGLTRVIQWWMDWENIQREVRAEASFELNRDFLINTVGARELRAIQQMYEGGLIPVEVLYDYLRKADVIPEWMEKEEFLAHLNDEKQFPNMADVIAKMKDYPDAATYWEHKMGVHDVVGNVGEKDKVGIPAQATAAKSVRTPKENKKAEK